VRLLDWLTRRRGEERPPRLVPLLTREEASVWLRLQTSAPPSLRVVPSIPLAFFVDGNLPKPVEEEVVPFVGVGEDGRVVQAWFFKPTHGYYFLLSLGLRCEVLGPEAQAGMPSPAPAPPPSMPQSGVKGASAGEGAPSEPPAGGASSGPPTGEEGAPPGPGADAPPAQAEGAQGPEDGRSDLYQDLASAWWRGEVAVSQLIQQIAASKGSSEPGPKEAQVARPTKEEGPRGKRQGEDTPLCPACGSRMVLRVAKRGKGAGKRFWSCSRYPECKGTRPYREPEA